MTDAWARRTADGPPPELGTDGSIEIELAGPGGPAAGGGGGGGEWPPSGGDAVPPQETNWRKVIAISGVLGVVAGIGIGIVISTGGDGEDDTAPTTTLDPEELASVITTPPTLPPVIDPPPLDPGPTAPTSQTRDLFRDSDEQVIADSGLRLVEFEETQHTPADGEFELTSASFEIGSSLVTQVTIRRDAEFDTDAVIVSYDVAAGRVRLAPIDEPEFGLIIDEPGGFLYNTIDGEQWERAPIAEFETGVGIAFDAYLGGVTFGPLRPDTLDGAAVTPRRFVLDDDGELLQEFRVEIAVADLPEWPLLYGLIDDVEGTKVAAFRAFVRADGQLVRTDGINVNLGRDAVLTTFVLQRGLPVTITLPPPELVEEISFADPDPRPTAIPGPDYVALGGSTLEWADVDRALASFESPNALTVTEWYPDGTVITQLKRAPDGTTWVVRQLTQPAPLAITEQITDGATGDIYFRDADNPKWRLIDEPLLGVVDDERLGLMIDAEFLRAIGPGDRLEAILDGESTTNRAALILQPEDFDPTVLTPAAEAGVVAGWPTFVDVLVSDFGVLEGLLVTPFDSERSLAIEQRFDYDADLTIDLPVVDG